MGWLRTDMIHQAGKRCQATFLETDECVRPCLEPSLLPRASRRTHDLLFSRFTRLTSDPGWRNYFVHTLA